MKIIIRDKIKRDQFNAIFNIIKVNSTCVNLNFNSNELHIQGMDKSHICLFNILIKKDWFNEYDCSNDGSSASFDTTTFYNIINSVSKNQSILISNVEHEYNFNEKNNDFIYVTLINEDYKEKDNLEFDKYYKLQLTENDYELMNIPETEYNCDFLINSKKIVDITSQMLSFNNDIEIKCCQEFIDFMVNGENGIMNVKIPTDDLDEFSIEDGEEFSFRYSLQYLNKFCLTKNLSDKIYFSLSNNCPLKIKYDLGDDIDVCFYIAPKLE
jgi:proliferating cell nuclear antigen PCNA